MSPAYDWRQMVETADFDRLSRIHFPSDQRVLQLEIRRLHQSGLKPRDIAAALRLELGAVLNALRDSTSEISFNQP